MIQDYSNHGPIKGSKPYPRMDLSVPLTHHDPVFLILIQIILKECTLNVSSSFQFWMKHKLMANVGALVKQPQNIEPLLTLSLTF